MELYIFYSGHGSLSQARQNIAARWTIVLYPRSHELLVLLISFFGV